jgi:hypothetical protein
VGNVRDSFGTCGERRNDNIRPPFREVVAIKSRGGRPGFSTDPTQATLARSARTSSSYSCATAPDFNRLRHYAPASGPMGTSTQEPHPYELSTLSDRLGLRNGLLRRPVSGFVGRLQPAAEDIPLSSEPAAPCARQSDDTPKRAWGSRDPDGPQAVKLAGKWHGSFGAICRLACNHCGRGMNGDPLACV